MTGAPFPTAWAWLALACYALHAAELVLRFPLANLLWSCNVAAAGVAVALFTGDARLNAAGCMLLAAGSVYWLLDLAGGGELLRTAPLTHVVELAVSCRAVALTRVPSGSAHLATATLIAVTALARLAGPASENVNLAFRIPRGYERWFPGHAAYLIANFALLALCFHCCERACGQTPDVH